MAHPLAPLAGYTLEFELSLYSHWLASDCILWREWIDHSAFAWEIASSGSVALEIKFVVGLLVTLDGCRDLGGLEQRYSAEPLNWRLWGAPEVFVRGYWVHPRWRRQKNHSSGIEAEKHLVIEPAQDQVPTSEPTCRIVCLIEERWSTGLPQCGRR